MKQELRYRPWNAQWSLQIFFGVSLDYLFGRSGIRYDLSILHKTIYHNKTIEDLVMLVNGMSENKQSLTYKMALAIGHTSDSDLR